MYLYAGGVNVDKLNQTNSFSDHVFSIIKNATFSTELKYIIIESVK